jgi:hypothetical protein
LMKRFGKNYTDYKEKTPIIIPWIRWNICRVQHDSKEAKTKFRNAFIKTITMN